MLSYCREDVQVYNNTCVRDFWCLSHTHARIHWPLYICPHVYVFLHIHIHTCAYLHIYMCAHVCICIYIHIYTYRYRYVSTYMCSCSLSQSSARGLPLLGQPSYRYSFPSILTMRACILCMCIHTHACHLHIHIHLYIHIYNIQGVLPHDHTYLRMFLTYVCTCVCMSCIPTQISRDIGKPEKNSTSHTNRHKTKCGEGQPGVAGGEMRAAKLAQLRSVLKPQVALSTNFGSFLSVSL